MISLALLIAGCVAALEAGYFRGPLIRFLAAHAHRDIRIDGALEIRLFSLNPRIAAAHVSIGNPPWTSAGVAAEVEKITLVFQLPGLHRPFGIRSLELKSANLHLLRDAQGHANWQPSDPDEGPEGTLPIIRSLSIRDVHVVLDDARRHLQFTGIVSAEDLKGTGEPPPLRIEGSGELNGRPDTFQINSDPLAAASRETPYRFDFSERSSGSRLTGSGRLLQPFDFDQSDTIFEATGDDLKDLFFLTGVTLVNTGKYQLSGRLARRGTHSEFSDLAVTSGQSDVQANVSIDSMHGRPAFQARVTSQVLRSTDLGARAAGREEDPEAGKLLLSNAMLSPAALRRGEWVVHFHAHRVDVGHIPLHDVSAKVSIDHGIVIVPSLLAEVMGGRLEAHIKTDARTDVPASDLDLRLTGVQLAQFQHPQAGPPSVEGSLQARVDVKGHGRSIHEVAATADGTVTGVVTNGTIRASLAELAGADLRALGLMISRNKQDTGIRCAVASFQARDGTLDAQSLVVDTKPVLITGAGQLHLDSESLDLELRGKPKSLRLFRLRAPLLVRGTLAHPSFGIRAGGTVGQAAAAVAVGVLLTPVAAILAFVDPGLAKDADCASLQAQAGAATH